MNTQEAINFLRSKLAQGDLHAVEGIGGKVLEHETIIEKASDFQCDLFLLQMPDKTFQLVNVIIYENSQHRPQVSMDVANYTVQEHAETVFLEVSLAHGFIAFGAHIKLNKSGKTVKNPEQYDGEKYFTLFH